MSESPKKFYLTTPIYYVNARPHIGHAYTTIAADVIARRHRLLGDDTFFLTGTDEHGQKIERSAAAAGIPPQQFADQVSASFKNLWDRMGITYNKFIRTTDDCHKLGAQRLFTELYNRGHIYLSTYTGAYCVSDEAFVDLPVGIPCPDCGRLLEEVTEENFFFRLSAFQQPLIDLIEAGKLAIQPEVRKNEVLSFLRGNVKAVLSAQFQELAGGIELAPPENLESHPRLVPHCLANGTIAISARQDLYVPGALKDLSISRSSFKWGIPVPAEVQQKAGATQPHIIYVWLDALANYMTAIGYGSDDPKDQATFEKYWPADLHLVGKEIIRFHCVYWPAFLMAANLPLPKAITAHGWLLFEDSKMSKSRGNIVRTETILDAFGTLCPTSPVLLKGTASAVPQNTPSEDAALAAEVRSPSKQEQDLFASDVLRYFLLREIPFGQDGSFSFDALVQRYNSDLANGYGNLVSRTLNMIQQYFSGSLASSWLTKKLSPIGNNLLADSSLNFEPSNLTKTIKAIGSYISALDVSLSEKAPWKLAKKEDSESRGDLEVILYQTAESIRIITALLYPILPHATSKVWAQLGLGSIETAAKNGDLKNLQWGGLQPGTKLGPLAPIFPRAPKELIQLMTDMESPTTPPPAEPTPSTTTPAATETPSSQLTTTNSQLPTEATPQITIDDFIKIDLRVAKILVAERIPKADKLLRLEVDLGTEKRQILSGIAEWYTPEELIGRNIVVIANLAPRKMRGLESHGMLLAASHEENGKPILATFAEPIPPGSRLK